MAMEWNPTTGRPMMTTAAAGTAPQPEPAPTMYRSAVMPPENSPYTLQKQPMTLDAAMKANYDQLQQAKLAEMNSNTSSLASVPGMESVSRPAVMPTSPEPRQFQTMIGTERNLHQAELQPQYQNMASHGGSGLQDQQRLAMEAMNQSANLNNLASDPATGMVGRSVAPQAPAPQAPQGPSTQPPAPQGNAYGKGGTQPQAQPQGNAYGKGGMQQANPATQAMSGAANAMGGTNQNAVNERMAGAMGSQAQAPAPQAPAPQQQAGGKGGSQRPMSGMNQTMGGMGGSPMMGGYTPPNNFSRPSYGGGKGGQMQQPPAPPPSYSGGGKGGSGYGYQRPQRPTYGGKGG